MLYFKSMSEHKHKVRRLWFRAKDYGWGWHPISWQGWAITVLFALLYTFTFLVFFGWIGPAEEAGLEARDLVFSGLEFIAILVALTYTLFRICIRYGEKPEWRWGKKR